MTSHFIEEKVAEMRKRFPEWYTYKPVEDFLISALSEAHKQGVQEGRALAYRAMASRIDSHGFIGLMEGTYELKEKKLTPSEDLPETYESRPPYPLK